MIRPFVHGTDRVVPKRRFAPRFSRVLHPDKSRGTSACRSQLSGKSSARASSGTGDPRRIRRRFRAGEYGRERDRERGPHLRGAARFVAMVVSRQIQRPRIAPGPPLFCVVWVRSPYHPCRLCRRPPASRDPTPSSWGWTENSAPPSNAPPQPGGDCVGDVQAGSRWDL
jgi:hypothetical protein